MHMTDFSFIVAGSGGAGAISTGAVLMEAASRAGWYAYMSRSVGAQIRGGEAAAMIRLGSKAILSHGDGFHLLLALDWHNLERFAAEMPLLPGGLVIGDSDQGEIPTNFAVGNTCVTVPLKRLAQEIPGGRANMVAMGVLVGLIGLPETAVATVLTETLADKGEKALTASMAALQAGLAQAASLPVIAPPSPAAPPGQRRIMTGNQAIGLGAIRGGIRFVAAYPITPATEILEWMAPALARSGGLLVQVEDELAAINQLIGASHGGIPALTATAGPGLALMTESIGLAVASETPIVVVDVMRGGPSTGIPAKSEQSDLNMAVYGLHGDAPHVVVAANSVPDCLFTSQWAVHLAEALQVPVIILSDQALGQARVVFDPSPDPGWRAQRLLVTDLHADSQYRRYALTASGVSPMALPGTPHGQYTADGLEHNSAGTPSSQAADHQAQMDKRLRKLTLHDYGQIWADEDGDNAAEIAILTWGSCTGPAREAVRRLRRRGQPIRLISLRLLLPAQAEKLAVSLRGISRLLVVEQSHGGQFLHYLRAHYPLPAEIRSLNRPGPLAIRPHEIEARLGDWSAP